MKVLMYGWEFPPQISGGLGIACHGIVSGLAEHNVDISLVLPCVEGRASDPEHIHLFDCRHSSHDFSQKTTSDFVRSIHVKAVNSWLKPYVSPKRFDNLLSSNHILEKFLQRKIDTVGDFHGDYGANLFDEVLRYALIAGSYAAEIEHDVIHAHEWLTVLAGVEARRISGQALIYHVHALETDRNPTSINETVFEIEKFGMLQADKIIAVSQYTKDCIVKLYEIPADKIAVVHNGLLPEQISAALPGRYKPNNLVLFLGRITSQKGPYYFVEAAKKTLKERRDVDFVMAGEGDLLREMIHLTASWRLGTQMHFTKFLDRRLSMEILAQSKVLVMPSISEPFGLVGLEAISKHVPPVLSKQSGVSEVFENCFTVDYWDTDKMVEQILTLIDSPKLSDEIVYSCRDELKNLLWSNQARKIMDIYSEF